MAKKFSMIRDINGYNGFGLIQSDVKYSANIVTGAAVTLTVPSIPTAGYKKWLAIFSFAPGASVWISINGTAATPAGATFASSTSELNPTARAVVPGDVISFKTSDTSAECGVMFYLVGE